VEHEPDDDRPLLRSTRLPPATAASLRSSADDHAAPTRDLREALDELRAELDGTAARTSPPAEPPAERVLAPQAAPQTLARHEPPAAPNEPPAGSPTGSSPSPAESPRRAGLIAVGVVGALAAVVLAAVGVVRIVAWSVAAPPRSSAASPAPTAAGSPSTGGPSPAAPSASSSASSSGASPAPVGPPLTLPGGLPLSGPGADVPGTDTFVLVTARGAVDVWERLVVRPGTSSVRLALASTAALPRTARVRLADLQVAIDGRRVAPRGSRTGWQVARPDGGSFTQVVVRYRLTGALLRATPAPPGRVTLVVRPVTGPSAGATGDPIVVRLTDRRVGAVYCPAARPALCAVSQGGTHVATVPAGTAPVVLAQLTLP